MTHFHVLAAGDDRIIQPQIRQIGVRDLFDALAKGVDDFTSKPSHVVFLCLIYPVIGVLLATWSSGNNVLQLLFPLASGFALIGPFAALGLYEISRRREAGQDTSWSHAFEVFRSPVIPSIAAVSALLLALFVTWLLTANLIYGQIFGPEPPASLSAFVSDVFTTPQGQTLFLVGNAVGLVFAVVVLCVSVVAFPIMLDRDIGAYEAIRTSVRAVIANPIVLALWGILVALGLAIGSLPLFAGLAVVFPILGHATWHLYRKLVVPTGGGNRQ